MTKQEFQELTQNIVLLDGATGSNLMAAGMPKGVCTEEWVLAHKDVIQNLQRAYIEAGSNIIYAPTFGGKVCRTVWRRSTALWFPIQEKSLMRQTIRFTLLRILPPVVK
jgi:methionine synthase I (cobalamin-dependent)